MVHGFSVCMWPTPTIVSWCSCLSGNWSVQWSCEQLAVNDRGQIEGNPCKGGRARGCLPSALTPLNRKKIVLQPTGEAVALSDVLWSATQKRKLKIWMEITSWAFREPRRFGALPTICRRDQCRGAWCIQFAKQSFICCWDPKLQFINWLKKT